MVDKYGIIDKANIIDKADVVDEVEFFVNFFELSGLVFN
jgi:hypothetical protein